MREFTLFAVKRGWICQNVSQLSLTEKVSFHDKALYPEQ